MGLDYLDLIFRLEKRFGIKISETEGHAVLFDTAGTIHRYLVAKLRGEYRQTPRIEPLFLEVSDAVNRLAGRWKFTCSNSLNKRFSPATRVAHWKALEEALGVSLPPLEHPRDQEFPRIPRRYESIFSLTCWIAENHAERVQWFPVSCEPTGPSATQSWSDDEIWTVLRECICDALGVPPKDVTYETRMIEDLGMD